MYLIEDILGLIYEYSFAVLRYKENNTWKWDEYLVIQGKKVSLFATDLNFHLNKNLPSNQSEYCFLAFHANRFNPNENNLMLLLFEIYDRVKYMDTEVLLVKYHYKPFLFDNLPLAGIFCESIFAPMHTFKNDLLLVNAEFKQSETDKLIRTNIEVKVRLKREIMQLALFHFYEKLLGRTGFIECFIDYLFQKEQNVLSLIGKNSVCFPVIFHDRQISDKLKYQTEMYTNLQALLYALSADIWYGGTRQRYSMGLSNLVLAPIINEIYLKCQEYFFDAEWPFISEDLLRNIRYNNLDVMEMANRLFE